MAKGIIYISSAHVPAKPKEFYKANIRTYKGKAERLLVTTKSGWAIFNRPHPSFGIKKMSCSSIYGSGKGLT